MTSASAARAARDEALDRGLLGLEALRSRRRLDVVVHRRRNPANGVSSGRSVAVRWRTRCDRPIACTWLARIISASAASRRKPAHGSRAVRVRAVPQQVADALEHRDRQRRHPVGVGFRRERRGGTAPPCRSRPAAAEAASTPAGAASSWKNALRARQAGLAQQRRPRSVRAACCATAAPRRFCDRDGARAPAGRSLIRVAGAAAPSASAPPRARTHVQHCSIHATRSASVRVRLARRRPASRCRPSVHGCALRHGSSASALPNAAAARASRSRTRRRAASPPRTSRRIPRACRPAARPSCGRSAPGAPPATPNGAHAAMVGEHHGRHRLEEAHAADGAVAAAVPAAAAAAAPDARTRRGAPESAIRAPPDR